MSMTRIETLDHDGQFNAYVARPADAPRGAIVFIQEIFGLNPGVRERADQLAQAGYLVVAPDLFWRIDTDTNLDPDVPEQMARAFELFNLFDQQQGIRDIEATIRWARAELGGGKVGCVGYCLGGRLAYMCATRTDVDASVGYYGVGIDGLLNESHAIARPLMLHIPTKDHFVTPEAQAAMHAGLDGHPRVKLYDYPGLDHGFAVASGNRRDEAGAVLADRRTLEFFESALA